MITENMLLISSFFALIFAASPTMESTISPSAIASGLMPVESIRTPFPDLSNKQKVKSPFLSLPACIRIVPLESLHCWVAPWILMPPSSDAIINLLVEMVPDRRSPTVTVWMTAFLINAESITAFLVVRWIFCRSPIPVLPDRRTLILP